MCVYAVTWHGFASSNRVKSGLFFQLKFVKSELTHLSKQLHLRETV